MERAQVAFYKIHLAIVFVSLLCTVDRDNRIAFILTMLFVRFLKFFFSSSCLIS